MQLIERGVQRLRAAQHLAELVLQDLRVQELLGVFPFVERSRLVQPLIALQANHLEATPAGNRLGELGLADAGRSLDQDGFCDLLREKDRGRDLAACDIALGSQSAFDGFNGGHGPGFAHRSAPLCCCLCWPLAKRAALCDYGHYSRKSIGEGTSGSRPAASAVGGKRAFGRRFKPSVALPSQQGNRRTAMLFSISSAWAWHK